MVFSNDTQRLNPDGWWKRRMSWGFCFHRWEAHGSGSNIASSRSEQPDESTHQGTSDMMSHAAEHRERGLCSICDNWSENWSKSRSRWWGRREGWLVQEGVEVSESKESLNQTRGFHIRWNLLHILDVPPASVVSRQGGQTCRCGWARTHSSVQCKQCR